jgi:UPF0716 family protein affecting phage T7 exclusion
MATGIVYIMLGVIAILSLLGLKHGGADEASLLKFLEHVPFGKVIIGLILAGMVGYIIWRMYEAINDPYAYGRQWKGIVIRLITAFSAVSDALIGWPALESLLGMSTASESGNPEAERQMFDKVMETSSGVWLVALIGLVTSITAVVQFIYVVREAYEERIDFQKLTPVMQKAIHGLSYAGHIARGTILGIMGFFMLKAAFTKNAHHIVNTDKAFDFIGDDVSHVVFALVALGTICYGFFMLAMGYYYDFRKGK